MPKFVYENETDPLSNIQWSMANPVSFTQLSMHILADYENTKTLNTNFQFLSKKYQKWTIKYQNLKLSKIQKNVFNWK